MLSLDPEEKIIIALRRYIIWLYIKIASFVFLLIIPLFFYLLTGVLEYRFSLDSALIDTFYGFFLSVYYVFLWVYFFVGFLDFWLDVWVITNHKITIINQVGLFNRAVAEISIEKIQDIKVEITGFLQTTLNYGSLSIRTASEETSFIFEGIAGPENVKNIIRGQMNIKKASQPKNYVGSF